MFFVSHQVYLLLSKSKTCEMDIAIILIRNTIFKRFSNISDDDDKWRVYFILKCNQIFINHRI